MLKHCLVLFFLIVSPCLAQNQVELNAKAQQKYEAADKEMKMVINDIAPRLDERTRKDFLQAQKAFEAYRAADGEAWGTFNLGGVKAEEIYWQQMTEVTQQRATYLRQWMEQFSF